MPFLPDGKRLIELIEADRLSRVTTDDEGQQHVMFWNGLRVQSMLLDAWTATRGAASHDPTPEESQAAVDARLKAEAQATQARQRMLDGVVAALGGLRGKKVGQLSDIETKILLTAILLKFKGIDTDLTILDPSDWLF